MRINVREQSHLHLNSHVRQSLTSFPQTNNRHIDYVIAYERLSGGDEAKNPKYIEMEEMREEFFDHLRKESFHIYTIEYKKSANRLVVFALLHCPDERLLKEAYALRLDLRLKKVTCISCTTLFIKKNVSNFDDQVAKMLSHLITNQVSYLNFAKKQQHVRYRCMRDTRLMTRRTRLRTRGIASYSDRSRWTT